REKSQRVGRIDRVRQANVFDSRRREDLGLADLCAADSARASLDLPPGDHGRFVGLGVRPELCAGVMGKPLRAFDVGEKTAPVYEDLRSRKIGKRFHPNKPGNLAALTLYPGN